MKSFLRLVVVLAAVVTVSQACFGGLGLGLPLGGGNCCPTGGSACGSRPLCSGPQYSYSYISPPMALPPASGYVQPPPASPPGYHIPAPYRTKN